MTNTDAQTKVFNEVRRRVLGVAGPMIRDWQVREIIDLYGYDVTPEQIDDHFFGDDDNV